MARRRLNWMLMHSFSSIKIVRRHLHSFLKVSGVIPSNSMPLEKSKRATFYDQFNLTERRKIRVWQIAYRKHPERFVRQPPAPLRLPAAIWINPPPKVVQDPIDGPSAEKIRAYLTHKRFVCLRPMLWMGQKRRQPAKFSRSPH
jgi:hypothetical protein